MRDHTWADEPTDDEPEQDDFERALAEDGYSLRQHHLIVNPAA